MVTFSALFRHRAKNIIFFLIFGRDYSQNIHIFEIMETMKNKFLSILTTIFQYSILTKNVVE